MKRRGHTLMELIAVVLIIAIISAVAFISIGPITNNIKINAAAKKVAADLEYARNIALATSQWYGISYSVTPTNSYSVYQTDGTTDTIIEDPARLKSNYVVLLSADYGNVTLDSVSIAGGTKVEFSPFGKPYTDKTGAAVGTAGTITLGLSGLTKTVQITPNTGTIIIL